MKVLMDSLTPIRHVIKKQDIQKLSTSLNLEIIITWCSKKQPM